MRDALDHALSWHEAGDAVALATVTETWGSAPCPVGSMMAVGRSGRIEGSVSGGCVESAVVQAALEAIESGRPRLLSFAVSDDSAWAVGLACGGKIGVFVAALRCPPPTLYALTEARAARRLSVLITHLGDGTQHLRIEQNGGLCAAEIDPSLCEASDRAAISGTSSVVAAGNEAWFVQVFAPKPRLILVGAVHVAQALAPMATGLGMDVTVVDPRGGFATPERFPGVALLDLWPDEAFERLTLDRHSAVVTLSHEARIDDPALHAALNGPAFYVGALGSRRTQAARRERLSARGHDAAALARLHGPVGLAIGAIGPQEIALSIMAEIVAVGRGAAR